MTAFTPIPGDYHAVVPPVVFHAVQQAMAANQGKGGRTGKHQNLFRHVAKCAYCGGPMRFVNKGEPPKGAMYLACDNGYRGVGGARHGVRYDELEAAILDNCEHLRPDPVLPNPAEQDAACHAIRQRLAGRDAELEDMEQRAANLLDQIERTTDAGIRDRYETRLRQLGGQKADLERQRADDETELRRTERNLKSFTKWQRMSSVVGQQAGNEESGNRRHDQSVPAFVAGEALPLADSNLGVYLTLHTIFGRRSLPAPATLGSKDPLFLAVQRDIENLLSYTPEMMASAGGLDQQRNQQVSRLTCTLALLSCKSALPGEMRYCHTLMQALLSARGDRVRTRADETLGLGTAFEPDFLHLYRSAKGKFTDNSISCFFQALLGSRTVPVRTDPELLRLMTIVCDCYSAKDASQLLNGLLRAHDKNPDAFARLANQGTIRTIIRKFPEHEIATVIKVTVVFIVRTALKDQADQLLQDMVENLSPDQLKRAAIRLANVLLCVREVHHELISSLLRTLKKPNAVHAFQELLGLLSQPSAVPQEPLTYDAQGIAAALYDRGLEPRVLATFVQRSRRLSLSAKLYEQLIREIDVLQRLLEKQGDLPTQLRMLPAAGQAAAEWLLPLLQLGLVTYQGEPLDYLVKAINVLSSDDFPAKDLALIIGRAREDLPRSLDLLAAPESSMESQTSGELGTALLTLWIKIEFLGQAQNDKMSAADLSRKLRLANARG